MEERADWVRTTLKGALAEDPAGIGWNTDFLRGRLRAEETQAAARAAQAAAFLATEQPVPTHHRCARCKWTFDPHDKRFVDSRRRHGDSPFCNRCVDLCQDSEIADHWCPVDDWNHQQPSEGGERS
jgi:hypothetical protein